MNRTTQGEDSVQGQALYMALDIGNETWMAAFAVDLRSKPRVRAVKATAERDKKAALLDEIAAARPALGVDAEAPVVSCYEAGAEGFWVHRWLENEGVANVVVASDSLKAVRPGKQAKTDRIDAQTLVSLLVRDRRGELGEPLRKVEVPPPEVEDMRTFTRSLAQLHKQETVLHNRLQSLLRAQGVEDAYAPDLKERLPTLVTGDGRPLGRWLRFELSDLCDQLAWTHAAIAEREAERLRQVTRPATELEQKASVLTGLRGIGPVAGTTLAYDLFWRQFENGKKVGSFLGLAPTPYASGTMQRDQGISKAGPTHLRALLIQLAWAWLRYQPDSELTRWYERKVGGTGKRSKRVAIVAVARRLAVLLWKYVTFGEAPAGAREKTDKQQRSMRAVTVKRRRTGPSKPRKPVAA